METKAFAADSSFEITTFDTDFVYQVEAAIVISSIENINIAYEVSKILDVKHFDAEWNKVWSIVEQKLASRQANQLNVASVQLELQRMKVDIDLTEYLSLITEDVDVIKSYAIRIKELYLDNYFKTELGNIQGSTDLWWAVTHAEEVINTVKNEGLSVSVAKPIGELVDDTITFIKDTSKPKVFSFGLPGGVDENIVDLSPGNTTIVAATPGQGKSALGIFMALQNAIAGDPVHLFSLEMSERQIISRFMSAFTHISAKDMLMKNLTLDQIRQLENAQKLLEKLPIKITPYADAPLGLLLQSIRESALEGTKLFIVDYIQLINYTGQASTRENMSYISQKLKSVALELDVAIVIMSQLSRHRTIEPDMFLLKESSDLEQSASLVALLYEDKLNYFKKFQTELQRPIFFKVDKQRNGERFKRLLLFTPSQMKFQVIKNVDLDAYEKSLTHHGDSSKSSNNNNEDDNF